MAFAIDGDRTRSSSHQKKNGTIEYRLIFAVTFLVFLCAGLFESLLMMRWLGLSPRTGKGKSVVQRARDSANTCAAYAFMG